MISGCHAELLLNSDLPTDLPISINNPAHVRRLSLLSQPRQRIPFDAHEFSGHRSDFGSISRMACDVI